MNDIKQISVFAQNKPGKIKRITEILSRHQINIRAITIASGDDYGIIKLIVNHPRRAHQLLKQEGLSVALNDVLAVQMKDRPGGLHHLMETLSENNINVEDAYGFVIKSGESAVLVINTSEMHKAKKILASKKINLL